MAQEKSKVTEIAVLQTQMEALLSAVGDIKTLVTAQAASAINRTEFSDLKIDYTEFKKDHEARLRMIENRLQQSVGGSMTKREILGWIVAIGAIMSAMWWLPELVKALSGK